MEPQEYVKVLSVPLTDAVSEPGAMMVVSGNTFLASPAVSGSQRNVNKANLAHPKTKFDFASSVAPFNGREILLAFTGLMMHMIGLHRNFSDVFPSTLAHLPRILNGHYIIALRRRVSCVVSRDDSDTHRVRYPGTFVEDVALVVV